MAERNWPPLPTSGFISGTPATENDLQAGDAVFVQAAGLVEALNILIPQYGWLEDDAGSERLMVVVQAERSDAGEILGLRDFDGNEFVATVEEVRLVGTKGSDQ